MKLVQHNELYRDPNKARRLIINEEISQARHYRNYTKDTAKLLLNFIPSFPFATLNPGLERICKSSS